jgi:hypothetical protein
MVTGLWACIVAPAVVLAATHVQLITLPLYVWLGLALWMVHSYARSLASCDRWAARHDRCAARFGKWWLRNAPVYIHWPLLAWIMTEEIFRSVDACSTPALLVLLLLLLSELCV